MQQRQSSNTPIPNASTNVLIGRYTENTTEFTKGQLDNIRIWNTARTQTQIQENMNRSLTGSEAGLTACYRADSIMGTVLTDLSPNHHNGTLKNWNYPSSWMVETTETPDPAEGDLTSEYACVRVLKTRLWNDDKKNGTATVGTEIMSSDHNAPHNGYVFWETGPYNPDIYNRGTMKGAIYPVNTHHPDPEAEDTIGVVWYRTQDSIAWPYQPVEYTCGWPSGGKRTVIASRYGSEGSDASGNDQTWPDKNGVLRNYLDPGRYRDVLLYNQPSSSKSGYNPNEEHGLVAESFRHADAAPRPVAGFALRKDLNITTAGDYYTSDPYMLIQYYDEVLGRHGMTAFKVEKEDATRGYTFTYSMKAGEPVVAPYPLNEVIAATPPAEIFGKNGDSARRCYWEDHKGQPWAISGNSHLFSYFWYPLDPSFWISASTPGDGTGQVGNPISWLHNGNKVAAGDGFPSDMLGREKAGEVRYNVTWPADLPVLKAGETLTFPGGEYRADNPDSPGLPGVLGWAAGQVVFDDLNPNMDGGKTFANYLVRLVPVLEERIVALASDKFPDGLKPASKRAEVVMGRWHFKDLHAGLKDRIFYDPMTGKLGLRGFLNGKTLSDDGLTAVPPSVYALRPNILTSQERDAIKALEGADTTFKTAVDSLYNLSRNPTGFSSQTYTVGLNFHKDIDGKEDKTKADPIMALGPGLAMVPNGALFDPNNATFSSFTEGYVTLAENNHPDMGALPVALHIVKMKKELYRGAIKTVFSENVFDEKITLRHTAEFGANPDDLVFQWWYREADGTDQAPPDTTPAAWKVFPDPSGNNGQGMSEIAMAGAGAALLTDNLFFCRYRRRRIWFPCPGGMGASQISGRNPTGFD